MTGAFLAALTARLRPELEAADAARAAETWHAADMLGLARELARSDPPLARALDAWAARPGDPTLRAVALRRIAHAAVTRADAEEGGVGPCRRVPRTRGDEPCASRRLERAKCVPRTRGDDPVFSWFVLVLFASPPARG